MSRALEHLRQMQQRPWLALDTETTGLGPYDVVVEIALIDSRGEVLADTLTAPERPTHRNATEIHGIDAEQLAEAPTWPSVWLDLQSILRSVDTVLVWNAAFDLRLIRQTCDRHHLPLQAPRVLCLRQAFHDRHPFTRSTLDAACLALGLPVRPRHRARADAEVARQVAWRLLGEEAPSPRRR